MDRNLRLKNIVVEHQKTPIGIDVISPRFGWQLVSELQDVVQVSYRIQIYDETSKVADSGEIYSSGTIDQKVSDWVTESMTRYKVIVDVWDNYKNTARATTFFETGRLTVPFVSSWIEPVQTPTPRSIDTRNFDEQAVIDNPYKEVSRDFSEFRPAQYIRIPFTIAKTIHKARVYATAHGIYQLYVNGQRVDDRLFAPEISAYDSILYYQTYDISRFLKKGKNVIGLILADGWWVGRVGTTGDCCQFGDKVGLLLDANLVFTDGSVQVITANDAISNTGPIIYSDLFVGEKYDARKELVGWNETQFDDHTWKPVKKVTYSKENVVGQYGQPIRIIKKMKPVRILTSNKGETILDVGQVVAGFVSFSLDTEEGVEITLDHSEVLDKEGNFYNNILGVNKEQRVTYITKKGKQNFCPNFTYHGFRYIKISGWPESINLNDFEINVISSEMDQIGYFKTSDERLNQLNRNIWWSQVANSISIPTDCPQREKAGWTGDMLAYAPTMCFNRDAHAFLTSWVQNIRVEQLEDGAIPVIVPYLPAYKKFIKNLTGFETSCGWGDAILSVPFTVYQAYGDKQILKDNYDSMIQWLNYIENRMQNHHPDEYASWEHERQKRSQFLWNTDFHFGDWLIPSQVLGNPDGGAMLQTAYATKEVIGPAYAAYSAKKMLEIASILEQKEDVIYYKNLYQQIREAFISEYVQEDGKITGDFQGIYVIALAFDLVPNSIKSKVVKRLRELIEKNDFRLDTGFLSVYLLMDVLVENEERELAYKLLFQTKSPSWLYMIEKGATTIWESWGAILEDGTVSTYSYNHYAFGSIGDWMYREIGGLQMSEPGYKRIRVAPAFNCGLDFARVSEETPYGKAAVEWNLHGKKISVHICIPPNTTAEIYLPDRIENVGSGRYIFESLLN